MSRVPESKIQKWLESNYKNLFDKINNIGVFKTKEIYDYNLDNLIKKKIIKSAQFVYNNLKDLELIIANKNISLEKNERLFPDLLLFNPYTNKLIIVEIKRSSQAERESITELLAYEQELQNIFPYMSKLEVCFIIISADYNTLLDHAIFSLALWQNRKVLPLKISGLESENEQDWDLSVYIPNSWSLLNINHFESRHTITLNLVLYDQNAHKEKINIKDKEENIEILQRGVELIIKEAEKHNSSGFVLLSRMTSSQLSNWVITIGIINPFSFFQQLDYDSKIKEELKKIEFNFYFDEILIKSAKTYLNIFYNTLLETPNKWNLCKKELTKISRPIFIDFFGELDNIINNLILSSDFRKNYFPELNKNKVNWKNPVIGLNLLDDILGENIFYSERLMFEKIYCFGVLTGTYKKYLMILKSYKVLEKNEQFLGMLDWFEIEFLKIYRKIYHIGIINNMEPISFQSLYIEEIDVKIHTINKIIYWIKSNFLNKNFKFAYKLGIKINDYFYNKNNFSHPDEILYKEKLIVKITRKLINKRFEEEKEVQTFLKNDLENYKKILKLYNYDYSHTSKEQIINIFEKYTIPLYSKYIEINNNTAI